MTKFSEKIVGKIQETEMKPISPWYFRLKNFLFWGTFVLAVFLGTIAFLLILISVFGTDFDAFPHDFSFHKWAILGHILVWIAVFSLFVAIAFFGAMHTKTGYKISPWKWIFGNFALTIVLGTLGFAFSDDFAKQKMENFSGMQHQQEMFWNRPEEGFLMGMIEKKDEKIFLIDRDQKKWELIASFQEDEIGKKHWKHMTETKRTLPPHPMRFFGKKQDENVFVIEKMMPPEKGKWRKEMQNQNPEEKSE